MNRRTFIAGFGCTVAPLGLAGCSESGDDENSGPKRPEHSGTLRGEDDVIHNIDVESGETIRAEVNNEAGIITLVQVLGPDGERVVDTEVKTEDTITYTFEQSGTFQVFISSDDTTSYEIYVDPE